MNFADRWTLKINQKCHKHKNKVRNSIAHKYEQFNEKFAAVFLILKVLDAVVVKFLKDEVER